MLPSSPSRGCCTVRAIRCPVALGVYLQATAIAQVKDRKVARCRRCRRCRRGRLPLMSCALQVLLCRTWLCKSWYSRADWYRLLRSSSRIYPNPPLDVSNWLAIGCVSGVMAVCNTVLVRWIPTRGTMTKSQSWPKIMAHHTPPSYSTNSISVAILYNYEKHRNIASIISCREIPAQQELSGTQAPGKLTQRSFNIARSLAQNWQKRGSKFPR